MMRLFWTSIVIVATCFFTPAHCLEECLSMSEGQEPIDTVLVREHNCSLVTTPNISTNYIKPNIVMVSLLEEMLNSFSEPLLSVFGLSRDGSTTEEAYLEFIATGTCYLLIGMESSMSYVVELSTEDNLDEITSYCTVICSSPQNGGDHANIGGSPSPSRTSMIRIMEKTCDADNPQPTTSYTQSFSTGLTIGVTTKSMGLTQSAPTQVLPPERDETFGTGAIIGTTLGGLAALIAFITILLVIIICYHQRRGKSFLFIKTSPRGSLTNDVGEYATPVDVITGPNAIDNPTAYTTPASVHYVKQSNASQTIDRNTARHSQMQDYEQNFASSSGVVEPQHYETALSVQSDNPLLDGTQAYEEPIDSILHYQNSQEEIQAVQQQYEVPLRTSSHGDQGKWHHHHQAIKPSTSFPVPGDKGKQEEKLPTYTSLHPGTMSEPQPYTPVNRTPSPGFYSTPSEQTKQANSTTLTTPQENHHYFVLDKGQHEKQQRSGKDPLYFVLESGNQKEESTKQGAFKNGHHDSVGTVTNADERIYYELEEHESNAPTLGPRKGSHLGTDGHAYFILERK